MQANAIIADDHPLFRNALRQAVAGVIGEDIAEADNFDQVMHLLAQQPDVELVFLDLNMPGNSGLQGLSQIRTRYPDVLVVIVSAEENPVLIRKAIELGGSGFIPKSTPLEDITRAVARIMEGEVWIPADMSSQMEETQLSKQLIFARKLAQLTPHQYRVLTMMSDGMLNKQIAYELDVAESTVKQHASAILRKLEVLNRTQAGVMFKQLMSAES